MSYVKEENVLIVSGGRNDQQQNNVLRDLWAFRLDTMTWGEVIMGGDKAKDRFSLCSVPIQSNKLLILGGM